MGNSRFEVDEAALKIFRRWFDHLRFNERYHLPEKDERLVKEFVAYAISNLANDVDTATEFFRARINRSDGPNKHEQIDMKAPPINLARAGRLNPAGIPYLYLSTNRETSIAEVRPWVGADITVAMFKPIKKLKIVNLNYSEAKKQVDFTKEGAAGELKVVGLFLSQSLALPQDPNDEVSYAPTQYLAEKFKLNDIDGIKYQSVLSESGSNLVLFDANSAEVVERQTFCVEKVEYSSKLIEEA